MKENYFQLRIQYSAINYRQGKIKTLLEMLNLKNFLFYTFQEAIKDAFNYVRGQKEDDYIGIKEEVNQNKREKKGNFQNDSEEKVLMIIGHQVYR